MGDGTLDLAALDRMTVDDVIVAITKVKGSGRWSADMFLMFRLNRPDVLPVGDLGIVPRDAKVLRAQKAADTRAHGEDCRGVAAVPLNRVLVSVEESRE